MSLIKEKENNLVFTDMTDQLHPGIYELFKIGKWYYLLKSKLKPIQWKLPDQEGTRVEVLRLYYRSDVMDAMEELQDYIVRISERYDFIKDLRWEVNM